MDSKTKPSRILCIAQSAQRLHVLEAAIRESGYSVLLAFTADHAVAVCVSHEIVAVILDAELMRDGGSGVAETLKLLRPTLPILLLDQREDPARADILPKGVDGAVVGTSPAPVYAALKALLGNSIAAGAEPS